MTTSKQRGYAAVQGHRLEEGALWLEKALVENPDDAQARTWLAQTWCGLGRRIEGTGLLRECGAHFAGIAANGGKIEPVLDIVAQLQQWSDFAGALDLSFEALRIGGPGFRTLQLHAANCSQLNRKREAVEAARQAAELAPANNMLQVFLGSLEADAGDAEAARTRLEGALGRAVDAREQFRAHKELARVLDRLGRYAEVFPHLRAAAVVAAALPEYSRQDAALLPSMIQANRTHFERSLFESSAGRRFADRPAPVFLVGFFRSGTTLTQEVLAAHPQVLVADEADFVGAIHRELHARDPAGGSTADKLRRLEPAGVGRLRDFYWERVRGRLGNAADGRTFVDKFTLNTLDLGLINCIFPDARVVFVMRDPRDVCLSCHMQLMAPTPATVHLLDWNETANFYAQVMDWWSHIKTQLTLPVIEFRYEDAVTRFEATYRQVFEFLGLPWDPAVAGFHERAAGKFIASPSRAQVSQPLYASSVGRWVRYRTEFEPVLATLQPYIERFGY